MEEKNKVHLKDDGRLDIDYINNLPIEEFMDVVGGLTEEQYEEFIAYVTANKHEIKTPVRPAMSRSLQEAIESGWAVGADEIIKNNN